MSMSSAPARIDVYDRGLLRYAHRNRRIFDGIDGRGHSVTIVVRRDAPALIEDAQKLLSLDHPGLIKLRDVQPGEGEWSLVTDWWPGPTLGALLGREPLDAADVAALLGPIAAALDALDTAGVTHHAFCAESVVVADTQPARLALIGAPSGPALAPPIGRDDPTLVLRMPESLDYVAPELLGRPARPDLYALAVLAYRLLAGDMPYPRYSSLTQTLVERQEKPPARLAEKARRPIAPGIETW